MDSSYSNQDGAVPTRVLLVSPVEMPYTILDDWRGQCRLLAGFLGGPVELWRLDGTPDPIALGAAPSSPPGGARSSSPTRPLPPRPCPRRPSSGGRTAAPTGEPCGAASASWRSSAARPTGGRRACSGRWQARPRRPNDAGAVAEIRRGIWETTGLYSEPAAPGWLAVSCESPRMAAWLCATIILENVEARCDEERLLVPADPGFGLMDEVKSVITVVAKTHHYWSAHVAGGGD